MSNAEIIEKLERRLADAQVELDEINESGDLEDRLDAAYKVEELERRIHWHKSQSNRSG